MSDTFRHSVAHGIMMHGSTLLETVLALAILSAVTLPIVSTIHRTFPLVDSRLEITGTWILEQEAAIIKAFPKRALPLRLRQIGNDEWILRTEKRGTVPVHYISTAETRGKVRSTVHFYGRADGDEK